MDIELHIQQVENLLNSLELNNKCRFASWCCNSILQEEKIKDNLFKLTNTEKNYQFISSVIKACWLDYSSLDIEKSIKIIQTIDWSEDNPSLIDDVATQGVIELITATENMLNGIKKKGKDNSYFAACAENAINWKDALANFPYTKDGEKEKQNLEYEFSIQILFLNDLKNGLIKSEDIFKFR